MAADAGNPASGILPYRQFRTGLTYTQVRAQLWEESCAQRQAGRDFITVRRQSVLGRWHEIKRTMYAHYSRYGSEQV